MNTKQLKSRSLLLLAVLLIASTAISWGAKPESIKKKEISKSFDVSLSDLLMTDNRTAIRPSRTGTRMKWQSALR